MTENLHQYLAAFIGNTQQPDSFLSKISFLSFYSNIVSLMSICYGIASGWPSPNILLLESNETPLPTGKITMDEASSIVALMCIGGLISNIFFGYIADNFGRKVPLLMIVIPEMVNSKKCIATF